MVVKPAPWSDEWIDDYLDQLVKDLGGGADDRGGYDREIFRAGAAKAFEEAAQIVHPWPHELPHVNHVLSKRVDAIRARAKEVAGGK